MALTFAKKKPAGETATAGISPATTAPANSNAPSWMKKGAAAKEAIKHEEAKAEERKAEAGKLWRFRMAPEGEGQITFLDGSLDKEGDLDIFMFYEHTLRLNGEWENFVCTNEADQSVPCPICESGDKASLVGVLTVIDHTPHTIKRGPNAGKVIKNTRKLFVAKRGSIELLRKLGVKRGGLAGCTFDVIRGDDKTPAVGSTFDFVQKFTNLGEIAEKYGLKTEDVQVANYAEEVRFRTPDELIALGVGKAVAGPGTGKASASLANEL